VFDLGKSAADFIITEVKLEEIVLVWPTSAETIEKYKTTVFPNPVADNVHINNRDGFQEYSVLNVQGEVLKTGNLSSYINIINLVRYPPGMYFMVLKNGNKRHSVKLVKR